jgi:hypothetical protein
MLDCPEKATTPITTNQLVHITEILALLDGFLRHTDGIADPGPSPKRKPPFAKEMALLRSLGLR